MKEAFEFIVAFIVVFIISVSMFQLPIGLVEAARNKCNSKIIHIEFIFPAYRLGCWLGERVDE